MRPEPDQFLHMHEPVFKNGLGDPRRALGLGHQGHELGLQIRRKAGEWRGGDIDRPDPRAVAPHATPLVAESPRPAFRWHRARFSKRFRARAFQHHIAAGHGDRHRIGAGSRCGRATPRGARPRGCRRPRSRPSDCPAPLIRAPILIRQSATIDDLRLARRVDEQRVALGERRGHERGMGAADRHLGKMDLAAASAPSGALA